MLVDAPQPVHQPHVSSALEVDMRQRHHVVGLAAVCLNGLFAISCAARLVTPPSTADLQPPLYADKSCSEGPTPGCRAEVERCDSLLRGGHEVDGVVHFRIAYDHDVDRRQKEAFKMGMEMWNKRSQTTRFVFEDAATDPHPNVDPNHHDFRFQRGAPRHLPDRLVLEETKCTAYASPGSYIWYSPKSMKKVLRKVGIKGAAAAYAHELGHALNVCHKPKSPLMSVSAPDELCHVRAAKLPHEIPEGDVKDAGLCGHGARTNAQNDDKLLKEAKQDKQDKQLEP
jgi:hypothetical protein